MTVLIVLGFNLVMLWLLEIPLACFLIAPKWTPRAIDRAKLWVSRHAHVFAVRGFAAVGALLITKGIIGLVGWPRKPPSRHRSGARSGTRTIGPAESRARDVIAAQQAIGPMEETVGHGTHRRETTGHPLGAMPTRRVAGRYKACLTRDARKRLLTGGRSGRKRCR